MTLLRELAEAPNNRLDIIAKLVELSYDAVDVLRKAEAVEEEEEPEQWLSLRYWASEVLGVIRRSAAVATWERIAEEEEEEESLVEGVAAFSAFHGAYPPEVSSARSAGRVEADGFGAHRKKSASAN